jgi:hypothetical protein
LQTYLYNYLVVPKLLNKCFYIKVVLEHICTIDVERFTYVLVMKKLQIKLKSNTECYVGYFVYVHVTMHTFIAFMMH